MSIFDIFKKKGKPEVPGFRYTPVLRNYDEFKDMVVHWKLSDDLGLFASRLYVYSDGSAGTEYVMKNQLEGLGLTEDDMMQQCINEFEPGEFEGLENKRGEVFYTLSGIPFCSAVAGLPESYEKFTEWVGSEDIIVGFPNPDSILITDQGSGFESHIMEKVQQSDYMGAVALTPSVFLWNSSGLKMLYRKEYEEELTE
jgi:hypothetical protein